MITLTPDQLEFLKANPEIRQTFTTFKQEDPAIALRYLYACLGIIPPPEKTRKSYVVRGTSRQDAQAQILQALRSGPKTRADLLALGLSEGAVDRNLPRLQRQGLIVGKRQGRNTPAVYRLTQEGQRCSNQHQSN